MGCCSVSPDRQHDGRLNNELKAARDDYAKRHKLLFLGSGGSGKSTFFKQLRCIHGTGFNDKDRGMYKEHIAVQIIEQIQRSVECIPFHNKRLSSASDCDPIELTEEGMASAVFMDNVGSEQMITLEIAKHIETLWREDAIRQIYKNRAIYHIDDSSAYFFDEIERIGDFDHYLPTNKDILYVRYRTTGVIQWKFQTGGAEFEIYDVGGQQNERKKWIHCFENVTAVIFVASLSCYDELMFEDDAINCMIDSLELFREICNLQWFVETPIILFLNKKDLFQEKIHIIPLSVCFPQFDLSPPRPNEESASGGTGTAAENESELLLEQKKEYMNSAQEFIKAQFIHYGGGNNVQDGGRQIYCHVTVATNSGNVKKVFNDVQQIVVMAGLQGNNLV